MKYNSEQLFRGVILILFVYILPCVHAQGISHEIDFFNNQFIPVEEINVEGEVIIVKYRMDLVLGPEEFGEDILYIFGKTALDYPNSNTIFIECFVGEELLFEYEMNTKDISDYSNERISDEEVKSRINVIKEEQPKNFIQSLFDWIRDSLNWLIGLIDGGDEDVNRQGGVTQTEKQVTDKDNQDVNAKKVTSKEATKAYQEYIAAYNKLTDLMSHGKGDTPEAQQAYKEYKEAKERYEQIAKAVKDE